MALPPIEITPQMLNKLLEKFSISNCEYMDVFCFEPEHLKTFPKQVFAVMLAFRPTPEHEKFRNKQAEEQKGELESVYLLKQTIENASGLVAMIHTVANNKDFVSFGDSSLKNFIDMSADASPEKRGMLLEKNEALLSDYKSAAEGFIRPDGDHCSVLVLVDVKGCLYELDGQTERCIDHGPLSDKSFLENAVKICKQHTEQAKDEVRFSAVALVKNA